VRSGIVTVVELVLRGIERDEIAAAVALIDEATLSPGVEDPRRLDDYWDAVLDVRQHGGELLVALHEGAVVGMCQIIVFRHFQHTAGRCCELESVFVRSDMRGRNVGAALVARAEAFAREKGCYRVQLASRNERLDAHRFYRTHGYVQNSQGFKKLLGE
jgi:GNAT superfamily N-acetyltransferase